jgi:hypothetical protein
MDYADFVADIIGLQEGLMSAGYGDMPTAVIARAMNEAARREPQA